jgi:hypothetical protein
MSKDVVMMNLERFAAIVEAYGGSPARWPDAERAAAVALMKASPEAQRLAEEAEALDGLLDMTETAPATRELQDRILAEIPASKNGRSDAAARASLRWRRWIPAAAVACSLVLGAVTGTQVPQLFGLDEDTLASDAVSSALTASTNDVDMFGDSE